MSLRVSRNLGPFSNGAQSIFAFKQMLTTSHGGTKFWVAESSGDGDSIWNSAADVITHNGSGPNGIDNSNSWFVLRDPDSNRWLLFERVSQTYSWNLWYQLVTFDTTGCGHSTPPSAINNPNRKSWMGARAAGPLSLFPTSGSWYYHICCEGDSPDGNVYPFWAVARLTGTGAHASAIMMDCVIDSLSPAADSDKAVLLGAGGSIPLLYGGGGAYLGTSTISHLNAFMRYGEANSEWNELVIPTYYDGANYYPGSIGVNPEDSKYPLLPAFVWRKTGTTPGVKGQLRLTRYKPSSSLVFGDTVYDGINYYLVVDDLLLLGWPDSTGPSV